MHHIIWIMFPLHPKPYTCSACPIPIVVTRIFDSKLMAADTVGLVFGMPLLRRNVVDYAEGLKMARVNTRGIYALMVDLVLKRNRTDR